MKAVYPGTFDPVTRGHADLIARAAVLFDRVIVAVAEAATKKTHLALDERVALVRSVADRHDNVGVHSFSGLLVDFTERHDARVVLRGLRAVSDFEYEFQLAAMNRKMSPEFESVFLMPAEEYSFVSSSLVWEIAQLGGDIAVFVEPEAERAVRNHCRSEAE